MEWKSAVLHDKHVVVPKTWLFIHYYEALNILFRTENALRVFVYLVLKSNLHQGWQDAEIQISDTDKSTIGKVAARRIAQARGYGYLGYEIASPLMHLNSGELTRLIMSRAYWPYFKQYFKGKQDIIQSKLEEINTVRNALAHFRPIKSDDIELIRQNVRHAFGGIELCLSDIVDINITVPTNTTEDWYRPLMDLQAEPCGVRLFQSKSAEWVRVELTYLPGMLAQDERPNSRYKSLKTFKLNTSAIPRVVPQLAIYCSFITEQASTTALNDNPQLCKDVSIVFSRAVLRQFAREIVEALAKLQSIISEETDLVRADHLARGSLVEYVLVHASRPDGQSWTVSWHEFVCGFHEDDPPEFWVDVIDPFSNDFVAGTARYPWMPAAVSQGEDPFD